MPVKISSFPQVGEAYFTDLLDSLRNGTNVTVNPMLECPVLTAGENLVAGAALYESGGQYFNAINTNPAKINVIGFSTNNVAVGNNVYVKRYGHITPISADSSNSIDDTMYLSNVSGQLTKVIPTGGNAIVKVGVLTKVTPALDMIIEIYPGLSNVDFSSNLQGGTAGVVPYQSAPNTTLFTAVGTVGQVLTSNGAAAPTWETPASSGYPDYTNYSALPVSATTGSFAITKENQILFNRLYAAGLWYYNGSSWNYADYNAEILPPRIYPSAMSANYNNCTLTGSNPYNTILQSATNTINIMNGNTKTVISNFEINKNVAYSGVTLTENIGKVYLNNLVFTGSVGFDISLIGVTGGSLYIDNCVFEDDSEGVIHLNVDDTTTNVQIAVSNVRGKFFVNLDGNNNSVFYNIQNLSLTGTAGTPLIYNCGIVNNNAGFGINTNASCGVSIYNCNAQVIDNAVLNITTGLLNNVIANYNIANLGTNVIIQQDTNKTKFINSSLTTSYTLTYSDNTILVLTNSANVIITIPDSSFFNNDVNMRTWNIIKSCDNGANFTLTIQLSGTDKFNNFGNGIQSSIVMNANGNTKIQYSLYSGLTNGVFSVI